MKVVYTLPEDSPLRRRLKEPLGEIIDGRTLGELIKANDIIVVGDACLRSALEYGEPLIGIYDKQIERKIATDDIINKIEGWQVKKALVENPRGTITEEAIMAIKDALRLDKRVKIEVKGEEDLLALPAIIHAKENMRVCYGQPGRGVVMVTPDKKTKETARKILKEMRA